MTDVRLDESQVAVTESAAQTRQLVVAGPGSGKTAASVERARRILSTSDEDRSVVFVSFSTAALSAADDAFDALSDNHRDRIVATTLDALAGQLIEFDYAENRTPDFDDIVASATARLNGDDYDGALDDVVHLVVDEVQDLSASRRRLLTAIIERLPSDAGFTAFGDPMQTIYGFLDVGESDAWQALRTSLQRSGELIETSLTGSYRARSARTRRIDHALRTVRTENASRKTIGRALEEALLEVPSTTPEHLARQIGKWPGSTAVLTRTNVGVLEVADHLLRAGIPVHVMTPGCQTPVTDRWVADLYAFCAGQPLTRESFELACADIREIEPGWYRELALSSESPGPLAWTEVDRLTRQHGEGRRVWNQSSTGRVVVSTIHQAKGHEFDNVVIVDPTALHRGGAASPTSQYETLYVGLTRARHRVFGIDWPIQFTRRDAGRLRTAYRTRPGSNSLTAIEVRPDDIRADRDFADRTDPPVLDDPTPGACIEFEPLRSHERPVYRCTLRGRVVGVTTDDFGERLKSLARTNSPVELGPVPIETIATASNSDISTAMFWTIPRPRGFAEVTYRKRTQ